jgi:hypothetical protein
MGAAELVSTLGPWMEDGYGDVEAATYRDGLVEVVFANGDVVPINPDALGVIGEFTIEVADGGAAVLVTGRTGSGRLTGWWCALPATRRSPRSSARATRRRRDGWAGVCARCARTVA